MNKKELEKKVDKANEKYVKAKKKLYKAYEKYIKAKKKYYEFERKLK
jgi:hypothetical protein